MTTQLTLGIEEIERSRRLEAGNKAIAQSLKPCMDILERIKLSDCPADEKAQFLKTLAFYAHDLKHRANAEALRIENGITPFSTM